MIWYNFILPLVLTVVIECLVARLFGIRKRSDLLTVMLANTITNPLVNLISYLLFHFGLAALIRRMIVYLILEPLIVVVEAGIYRYNLDEEINGWLLSLAANLTSILGGLLCLKMFY